MLLFLLEYRTVTGNRGVRMYYSEENAIKKCEEEPSLIFELISMEQFDIVDKILSRKKVSLNTTDSKGNDIITRLLRAREFNLVLKYMKDNSWNINHQNHEGNTFAHYLVSINYVYVVDIIKTLKRKRKFIPNIKNKKGETILDKSINENYIYTTLKILSDKRFNNIDVYSFKRVFDTYIKNSGYGKYSKLNNLEIIVGSLEKKDILLPNMKHLLDDIKKNMDIIKHEIMTNKFKYLETIIQDNLLEASL